MRSPALAIAWEFRQRHRLGLIALATYVLVLGTIKLLILGPGQPVNLDDSLTLAAVLIVPLSATFMYFLAVFSFGFAGDLAARQSMYPARMFTLPVTTAALAGWPMLYGTAAVTTLLLTTASFVRWEAVEVLGRFALRPWGIDVPLIWPALLGAVFLAWTQVLTWMPYGLRGLRVILAVLWLATLDAGVFLAIEYKVREPLMVAGLAPQLPLAYLAACLAVARARRGDVPDWRGSFARLGRITDVLKRRRDDFPSPARAQMWFEWRRYGRSLPVWVAILLPFELALLFVARNTMPQVVFFILFGVLLLTPPFMAGFAAARASTSNPHARDSHGLTPFHATRPLTSAALIAAQLKMAIGSTLLAWLLVLIAIVFALTWAGAWPTAIEGTSQWVEAVGRLRAAAILLLGSVGLLALTWKQLVQNLYVGLTGREWAIKASVSLTLSFLVIVGPMAEWIMENKGVQAQLWDALPWIAALLVCLKMSAAAWIATRLHRHRLIRDGTLVAGAFCWLVVVLGLYGLLAWLLTTPLIPRYILALVAVLAIPLVRLSAAPLALAWNRHR